MTSQEKYVNILLPQRIDQAYTYRVPKGYSLKEGQFVEVSMRNKILSGVVWSCDTDAPSSSRVKEVAKVYDCPAVPQSTRDFVKWVASYAMAPLGNVLKMAMSVPQALEPEEYKIGLMLAEQIDEEQVTPKRQNVINFLKGQVFPLTTNEISTRSNVSLATVREMLKLGILKEVPMPPPPLVWRYKPMELSGEQKEASDKICKAIDPAQFKTFLLDGVTGSGKTEVYFEAIGKNLEKGKQSLVLLPEISLSAQWIQRFTDRFGTPPVVWHSDMTPANRRRAWRQVITGEAKVVVGARSALFLPYPNLGLIVVDEEHESAYKQEEGVIYNARDMAVVRGRLDACLVVLVSATPSLESLDNAKRGRYQWLKLHARHGAAQLPSIHIIDMRKKSDKEKEQPKWISETLYKAIDQATDSGQQALVFLNRRGYAPLTLCQSCGERISCPHCTAWLVEHKVYNSLICHHCGHTIVRPKECFKCGDAENIISCGPGVERVAEELDKLFPTKRIEIMSSDIVTSLPKLQNLVDDLHQGRVDIVVGTQMIAKGHHFPNLTVVGVVDADLGLAGGDLRAGERTYQLLHQVAGRAGRADLTGHVYLQTFNPTHPVLTALVSGSRDEFIEIEERGRKMNDLPPYGRLAAIIVSSQDKALVESYVQHLARSAPTYSDLEILGPAPAALAVVRNWHRWRFLLKSPKDKMLQPVIEEWLNKLKHPSKIKLQIDIDPYSFL